MDNYQPHPYYERSMRERDVPIKSSFAGVPTRQALFEAGYTDEQVDEALARARTVLDGEPTAARTPSAAALWHAADQEAMYRNAVLAEPEGYDEHLDDIERRIEETVTLRAHDPEGRCVMCWCNIPHDLALPFVTSLESDVLIAGCVRVAGHAAFVPKGGGAQSSPARIETRDVQQRALEIARRVAERDHELLSRLEK